MSKPKRGPPEKKPKITPLPDWWGTGRIGDTPPVGTHPFFWKEKKENPADDKKQEEDEKK